MARAALRHYGVEAHADGANSFTFGRLHALEEERARLAEESFHAAMGSLRPRDVRRSSEAVTRSWCAHTCAVVAAPSKPGETGAVASREPPTGTVTFLFTDIEGSTRLTQELGAAWPPLAGTAPRDRAGVVGGARRRRDRYRGRLVLRGLHQPQAGGGRRRPDPARARGGTLAGRRRDQGADGAAHRGGTAQRRVLRRHRRPPCGAHRQRWARRSGAALGHHPRSARRGSSWPSGVRARNLGEHRLKDLSLPERIYGLEISGLRADFPPLKTLNAVVNNLPGQLTSFLGRDRGAGPGAAACWPRLGCSPCSGPGGRARPDWPSRRRPRPRTGTPTGCTSCPSARSPRPLSCCPRSPRSWASRSPAPVPRTGWPPTSRRDRSCCCSTTSNRSSTPRP